MEVATENYQNQLKARIANLLNSYKQPSIGTGFTLEPDVPKATLSVALKPELATSDASNMIRPHNMDVIEAKLQGSTISKPLGINADNIGKLSILDLQISNIALFLVLVAFLGGTIYYWMMAPIAKNKKNTFRS